MKTSYKFPPQTQIDHLPLKVSNLQVSLNFFFGLPEFEIIQPLRKDVTLTLAGGYYHHIGLNSWHGSNPAPQKAPGLYHTAIKYPARKNPAKIYHRLQYHQYPLTGTANHRVSEALYLSDPDKNGKPGIFTKQLKSENLLNQI